MQIMQLKIKTRYTRWKFGQN